MARLEAERAAAGTQMSSLPEECVREILLRLSDADDLDRAGRLVNGQYVLKKKLKAALVHKFSSDTEKRKPKS